MVSFSYEKPFWERNGIRNGPKRNFYVALWVTCSTDEMYLHVDHSRYDGGCLFSLVIRNKSQNLLLWIVLRHFKFWWNILDTFRMVYFRYMCPWIFKLVFGWVLRTINLNLWRKGLQILIFWCEFYLIIP